MNKEIKKLFVVLALYALAGGFFYNFQEMWLLSNSLSIKTISTVLSLCAISTISVLFLCSSIVRKEKLKRFTLGLILTKFLILLTLFFINNSGLLFLIKFLIMTEYVIDVEIYACIYPMISEISKGDKIYAARKIVYDAMYFLGVLITCLLLGKSFKFLNISYNSYLLIAALIFLIAFIVLSTVKFKKEIVPDEKHSNYFDLIKRIKGDKITASYLLFGLFGNVSYYSVNGMTMIVLTEGLGFSAVKGSMLVLVLGLLSVLIGLIILKFTFKNDYINISIKFLVRTTLYLLAFLINNKIALLIAIIFVRLSVDSFDHISDAPYVNRFNVKDQFSFANMNDGFKYLGRAIGTLICGAAVVINIKYNFLFAFIFGLLQTTFAYIALYLRKKENNERNN